MNRKHQSRPAAPPREHLSLNRRDLIRTSLITAAGLSLVELQSARPAAAQASECLFAIIGDYGWSGTAERDVASLVKSWSPELIATLGDNNYGDKTYSNGAAQTIDKNVGQYYQEYIHPYRGSYGAGAETNRFFPALADKDWHSSTGYTAYLDYFTLPNNERYYDFTWGPVHFFMLNSEKHEPDGIKSTSVQAKWLQARLAASTAPWKLVVIHHPPYGTRGGYSTLRWPFKEWGADAVLSGQHHIYERLLVDGLTYVINGLGGRSRGNFDGLTPAAGSLVRYGADYGAQRVTAAADRITFEFFTRTGELIDSFTLWAESALPAPGSLSATVASESRIDLGWSDNSVDEDGFIVQRSADGGSFTALPALPANTTAYQDTAVTAGVTYAYVVRAFKGDQLSAPSNTASAKIHVPPAAPSDLAATATVTTRINLAWTDHANNEEGVEIERSTDGTQFSVVGVAGPDSTSFVDDPGAASTTFYYRVRAFAGDLYSDYSNVASATTPDVVPGENLLAFSEQFDRWTTREGCVVTADAAVDPNGAQTADRVDDAPAASGYPAVYTDVTVPETGPYVFSCYLQAGTLSLATVRIDNLNTKVRLVETPFTLSAAWQRIAAAIGEVTAGHKLRIYLYPGQYKREGGSALAWGAQLERGSTPGLYQKKPQ
ncbi:MAG: metallophosphoesterase [Armatimonadota bacterium]